MQKNAKSTRRNKVTHRIEKIKQNNKIMRHVLVSVHSGMVCLCLHASQSAMQYNISLNVDSSGEQEGRAGGGKDGLGLEATEHWKKQENKKKKKNT